MIGLVAARSSLGTAMALASLVYVAAGLLLVAGMFLLPKRQSTMDDSLQIAIELNEYAWARFKKDLEGVTSQELDWRPVPEANTINLIVKHLRIDTPWHLPNVGATLPEGDPVPLDFERNMRELDEIYAEFITGLRRMTLGGLEKETRRAYGDSGQGQIPAHFVGFHLALHVARHWGQVCTLRNLYCKTRGEPARFFPDNPSFPQS